MKLYLILLSIFLSAETACAQSLKDHDQSLECQKNWKYLNLEKDIRGVVLYYDQPVIACGVSISTASVALIKTAKGDTLRILTLCNTKKEFKVRSEFEPGYNVYIRAVLKPPFRVDLIPVDPYACSIKEAYFGTVQPNPNQARVIR